MRYDAGSFIGLGNVRFERLLGEEPGGEHSQLDPVRAVLVTPIDGVVDDDASLILATADHALERRPGDVAATGSGHPAQPLIFRTAELGDVLALALSTPSAVHGSGP